MLSGRSTGAVRVMRILKTMTRVLWRPWGAGSLKRGTHRQVQDLNLKAVLAVWELALVPVTMPCLHWQQAQGPPAAAAEWGLER